MTMKSSALHSPSGPARTGSYSIVTKAITVFEIFRYFARSGRLILLPVLLFLLVSGVLLLVTGGLSYVAPFVYAVF